MAFWGIQIRPSKPYTFQSENEKGRLHLSQATLGSGSSTGKNIVKCKVGDKKPIYLCSLLPERLETCALNIEFEEDEEVTLSTVGPRSVYLSGFFYGDTEDQDYHEDCDGCDHMMGIDSGDEDDSTDYDSEDEEDDDDYSEDALDIYPLSHVLTSGLKIEEIEDDEKPTNENVMSKRAIKKKIQSGLSDGNENSKRKIVAKAGTSVPIVECEDQDGLPVPARDNTPSSLRIEEIEDDENPANANVMSKQAKEKKIQSGFSDENENSKRRIVAKARTSVPIVESEDEDGFPVPALRIEEIEDDEKPTNENVMSKRAKKKKIQSGLSDENENSNRKIVSKAGTSVPIVECEDGFPVPAHDNKTDISKSEANLGETKHESIGQKSQSNSEKTDAAPGENLKRKSGAVSQDEKPARKIAKKKKKQDKLQENAPTDKNGSVLEKQEKEEEAKSLQVRTFSNGLVIEELAMGKPAGKRASPGKKVSVRYIGKLKKTGKIFDSNIGGPPFKFRLGIGQVIKGWDVGVNGMRIGDKRRLTIPPAMGYGPKGCGAAIPPNSWLMFDVELVDAN